MIILICLILLNQTYPCVQATSKTNYYARVLYEQVYLYKSPIKDENCNNIYFEIPKTYFVKLIDEANESFYKVNYLNFSGYVKKESVKPTNSIPITPYLENINFRVYADLSRELRSEPNKSSVSSTLIANIPLYSRNIQFYGRIFGESLIDGRTNTWYYCKYSADKDYYGYVYSDFCDEMPSTLPENNENVNYVAYVDFNNNTTSNQTSTIPINNKSTIIIVILISIPALIFAFMIIKGKNILNRSKINDSEIVDY